MTEPSTQHLNTLGSIIAELLEHPKLSRSTSSWSRSTSSRKKKMQEQKMKEEQERRKKKKLEKRMSFLTFLMLQEKLWHYRKKSTCLSCSSRKFSIKQKKKKKKKGKRKTEKVSLAPSGLKPTPYPLDLRGWKFGPGGDLWAVI